MTPASHDVLKAAMQLNESDRAELIGQLMDSVSEDMFDPGWAAIWEAEVARRLKELDSGQVQAIPWEKVRQKLWDIANKPSDV